MKRRYMRGWLGFLLCLPLLLSGCARAQTELAILKIGKADAILLMDGGQTLLIDGGEEEDGEEILAFLSKRNIKALDAMIITHFDKDHVGGADTVFLGIPVLAVYDAAYEADTKPYRDYVAALGQGDVTRHRIQEETAITIGSLKVRILPSALISEDDNDHSLIISAEGEGGAFLFMGDATEARIGEYLAGPGPFAHDFIKMPHHGRCEENLPDLLKAVGPRIAAITDSDKNPAAEETVALLDQMGIVTYHTRHGDILLSFGED